MQEIRCGNCHRKLGEGIYIQLSIKCPRCKTMNTYNHIGAKSTPPACHRASRLNATLEDAHVCQPNTTQRT
ncbi:Com family DNA-binding transcriptional regulator [Sapientia aquatica]|uniref:Com family DNA-binding transcriptional regulator n=1 Tax=Sapientia aquatica TaxID=1549640 RepID=A0A4R5W1R3_9BURK|nr:Com family DNA-binding transcriptional regulator [Sapientia aquatica]TDK65964.1 Com family DNA-binding transcriptional regulator [Sapientia aquatica]